MRTPTLLHLPLLALVACGPDEAGSPDEPGVDATGIDAVVPDAEPATPDEPPDAEVPPDAMVAAVIAVDCEAVAEPLQLSTAAGRFVPEGTLTIPVDGVIRFRPAGNHNFASAPDAPPGAQWRSGSPGHADAACFRFTTAGDYPFVCEPHAAVMNGVVRVE